MMPLISHVIAARNDNYLGNFKHRLELMLNYNSDNVQRSGFLSKYEVVVVDWNSETPLRNALNLNDAARKCTKFLEVTPDIIQMEHLPNVALNLATAFNVGIRRCMGEMVMITPADVLFPYPSIRALFDLMLGVTPCPVDIGNCYLGVPRYLIPWQASEKLVLENLDSYFCQYAAFLQEEGKYQPYNGGEGAHIISRRLLHEIRGTDERLVGWGGTELNLCYRLMQVAPQIKSTFAGVFCYDLQSPNWIRESTIKKNPWIPNLPLRVNDEKWGLEDVDIPMQPALHCPEVNNSPEKSRMGNMIFTPERPFACEGEDTAKAEAWYQAMLKVVKSAEVKCAQSSWIDAVSRFKDFYIHTYHNFLANNPIAEFDDVSLQSYFCIIEAMRRIGPSRFLLVNARHRDLTILSATLDPTMDITLHDDGINTGYTFSMMLKKFFHGRVHWDSGPMAGVFSRISKVRFAQEPYGCVFLDATFLRDIHKEIPATLPNLLGMPCAVIVKGESSDRKVVTQYLGDEGFKSSFELSHVFVFVRIDEEELGEKF